jgi:hypothetical protein
LLGQAELLANRQGIHTRGNDDVSSIQTSADNDGICLVARDGDEPQGETVGLRIKRPDSREAISFK